MVELQGAVTLAHKLNTSSFLRMVLMTCLLTGLFCSHLSARQVVLNEVMASNSTTIADEDGDYPDWIELYNHGSDPVELGGYGLSDDLENPFRWVFPDTTLAPGQFMLVMASGKDRSQTGGPLHTNFAIASAGEEVLLTRVDGELLDLLSPRQIPTDWSVGRYPDGEGEWVYFEQPTPGSANITEPIEGLLEAPIFSHSAGFYREEFELEITHEREGVRIYYTLDGSEPTRESAVYEGPILIRDRTAEPNTISMIPTNNITSGSRQWQPPSGQVRKATVLRTLAEKPGMKPSSTASTYFVFPEGNEVHTLPVISISTNAENLFDEEIGIYVPGVTYDPENNFSGNYNMRGPEWERPISLEYFETSGERVLAQQAGVRIHGGWSRRFSQKSLRLYARSDYGESSFNYPFFSDRKDDSYNRLILRNSGNDQGYTMIRDAAGHEIAKEFSITTQSYQPAVVYINGEYWGILNIRERYDRHFLERVYGVDPDNIDLLTFATTPKEGDHLAYVQMLRFIVDEDLSNDKYYQTVETLIDMNSLLDYYSAQIFYANTDWPHNNIDFWRARVEFDPNLPPGQDGRWRWLMYDLDFGLGLVTSSDFDMFTWMSEELNLRNNQEWSNVLFRNLLESERFRHSLINRIGDHLNSSFQQQRMSAIVRSMASAIEEEMPAYSLRWRRPSNLSTWDRNINGMIEWLRQRRSHLYRTMADFFEISSLEEMTIDVNDPSLGIVEINSMPLNGSTPGIDDDPFPWTGIYFSGIPVKLSAVAQPGYRFSRWQISEEPPADLDLQSASIRVDPALINELTAHFIRDDSNHVLSYWLFTDTLPNNTPLGQIEPYFGLQEGALLEYINESTSDSSAVGTLGFMDRVNDPTTLNYLPELSDGVPFEEAEENLRGVRVRNPSLNSDGESAYLMLSHSTAGYEKPSLTFAAKRTANGQRGLRFYYSTSADTIRWKNELLPLRSHPLNDEEEYELVELSFSDIPFASNNPFFRVRIGFGGDEAFLVGESGNVRFNNIAFSGTPREFPVPPQVIPESPEKDHLTPLEIELRWQPLQDALYYEVQISEDEEFDQLSEERITVEERVQSSFDQPGTYFWRVRGWNGSGSGPWSEVRTFTVTGLPVPHSLQLVASDSLTVELEWVMDTLAGVEGYRLYRGGRVDSLEEIAQLDGQVTRFTDHLEEPASWLYAVRALYSPEEQSPMSNLVSYHYSSQQVGDSWALRSRVLSEQSGVQEGDQLIGFDRVYRRAEQMQAGRGYWHRSDQPRTQVLYGQGLLQAWVAVEPGWNLIGSLASDLSAQALVDTAGVIGATALWEYEQGAYQQTQVLRPGGGYWLYAQKQGWIGLQVDSQAEPKRRMEPEQEAQLVVVSGESRQLFGIATGELEPSAREYYLAPPLSPQVRLDLRTRGGYTVWDPTDRELVLHAEQYPVRLYLQAGDANENTAGWWLRGIRGGEPVEWPLRPGGQVVIEEGVEQLRLEPAVEGNAVREFRVRAGYPNPFERVTRIDYELPETTQVLIEVYDVAGRRVAILVNEHQQAGRYSVEFDGSAQASGIYFVQVQALGQTSVQKLTRIQ